MDITQIPFNKYIDISESADVDSLELSFNDNLKNHIGTFHASAQFALAEACSGLALQTRFSDVSGAVLPVLRKTETKFKKPASSQIKATASIAAEAEEKFTLQFEKRGRATIAVLVDITDENGTVTMSGTYEWFVQKL